MVAFSAFGLEAKTVEPQRKASDLANLNARFWTLCCQWAFFGAAPNFS